jgi:hypothetical protein
MASVTLHLSGETERKLRERATHFGQTLEGYLEQLAEQEAATPGWGPMLPEGEFERLLEELSAGPALPHLLADFSRADVYADHD